MNFYHSLCKLLILYFYRFVELVLGSKQQHIGVLAVFNISNIAPFLY